MESIEELYGIKKKEVNLKRVRTKSGKWLEWFKNPGKKVLGFGKKKDSDILELPNEVGALKVEIEFPEFTCLCPRTGHPDFANITLRYVPDGRCVELKSLKYYYSSMRNEGHFHEAVVYLIYKDLLSAIKPSKLEVIGDFNIRGGTQPIVRIGDRLE